MSAPAGPATTGTLRLATRGSALARAQCVQAATALGAAGAVAEPVIVRTTGDRNPRTPADRLEGDGWFTAELERALLEGRAELAVHSAKDLPTELAPGLALAAHLPRGDARDALVARGPSTLASLPAGARIGTGSPRRRALIGGLRPDVEVVPIRGNVDTRLRKLDSGEVDALLLAAAGLDRLGLGERIGERLDPRRFPPAPAQGAIALEAVTDAPAAALAAACDDAATTAAVIAERAVLRALGGGCRLPLGAHAWVAGGRLHLVAALARDTGERREAEGTGALDEPEALGSAVAAELR